MVLEGAEAVVWPWLDAGAGGPRARKVRFAWLPGRPPAVSHCRGEEDSLSLPPSRKVKRSRSFRICRMP